MTWTGLGRTEQVFYGKRLDIEIPPRVYAEFWIYDVRCLFARLQAGGIYDISFEHSWQETLVFALIVYTKPLRDAVPHNHTHTRTGNTRIWPTPSPWGSISLAMWLGGPMWFKDWYTDYTLCVSSTLGSGSVLL